MPSIHQNPDERFQNFVSCFLQVSERLINNSEANKLTVQQLPFGNANQWCKEALGAHEKWATLSEIIQIYADIGPSYIQEAALEAAISQASDSLEENEMISVVLSTVDLRAILPKIALLHW